MATVSSGADKSCIIVLDIETGKTIHEIDGIKMDIESMVQGKSLLVKAKGEDKIY